MSVNKIILSQWYLEEKKSLTDISKMCDLSVTTVRRRLISYEIPLRTRSDGIRNSRKKLGPNRGKSREFSEEWKDNIRKARLRWSQKHAKGIRINTNGYYEYTKSKHKGRMVHIVIMEQFIGRPLIEDEIVHHKNGIKTDNRIENLEIMTRSEHSRHHASERILVRDKEGRFVCQ